MFSKKDLYKLIIPLIVEQFLNVTIGMAATIMVASAGEAAVSGISLVDTINVLLINVFSALATGGAVVSSQYLGRKDTEQACIAAKQLVLSITFLSLFIMIIALTGQTLILNVIFGNIDTDVMGCAKTYFLFSAISYPFLALYNSGAALFRAMGNSKISMLVSLIMNVVNISGNALLIYNFHLGVLGAAISLLASRIAGALIMIILLQNHNNPIHIKSLFQLDFKFGMIKNILHIGVPNGLESGMFQVGKLLVQGLIASFGTTAIAANAVANSIAAMEVIPASAIGLALITVVGQCVGAKDYDQAKKYTNRLLRIAYTAMGFINIPILIAAPSIVGIYNLSSETMQTATQLLVYHTICCTIIWPASFTLPNGLRAASDVKYPMIISIISMWTFRIGFSYILGQGFGMGVLGVWIAMTVDWLFRAICFIMRFLSGKWKRKQLI